MEIEGRRKGALLLTVIGLTVPVAAALYFLIEGLDTMMLIAMIMSLIITIVGVPVYLGHTILLAGFNTMSPGEREEYDMEMVTSFIGTAFVISGVASFFAMFITLLITSDGDLAFVIFFLIFLFSVLFTFFYPSAKRFKA